MSVILLVEGKLETELLSPVLAPGVHVKKAGSKYDLPKWTQLRREENKDTRCYYLRDRDFDFDPPEGNTPGIAKPGMGWHWCRHEMENYLLEPAVVVAALHVTETEYVASLLATANHLHAYQAARWVVGMARRQLPPGYQLATKEDEKREFFLPDKLAAPDCQHWVVQHVTSYGHRVHHALSEEATLAHFAQRMGLFQESAFLTVNNVLTWFSGKDLMEGLRPWYTQQGVGGPAAFRNKLSDWMEENSDQLLDLLPEWRNFKNLLEQA